MGVMFKLNNRLFIVACIFFLFSLLSVEAFPNSLERESKQVANNKAPQLAQNINLSEFIRASLKDMGAPSGATIPGLTDANAFPITGIKKSGPNITLANIETGKILFDLVYLKSGNRSLLFIGTSNLNISTIVPGMKGTPLGSLGTFNTIAFVYASKGAEGKPKDYTSFAPNPGVPIPETFKSVFGSGTKTIKFSEGLNLVGLTSISNFSPELKKITSAAGLPPTYKIAIGGKVDPSILKKILSVKSADKSQPGLVNKSSLKTKVSDLLRDYGAEFIKNLNLRASLPKNLTVGPLKITDTELAIYGNDDNEILFGITASEGTAFDMKVEDILASYDVEKKEVTTAGKVLVDELPEAFNFTGLTFNQINIVASFSSNKWDFKLAGDAELNGIKISSTVEFVKVSGKHEMKATLKGIDKDITPKDAIGRSIPGLDAIGLTSVVFSNGRIVADIVFGPKKTPGEIAAFHVGSAKSAFLAVTLDKLAFSELVPGGAGTPINGVDVDNLTIIVIPPKGGTLKPDSTDIPEHIAKNLQKTLTDAGKISDYSLNEGINFFAELEISKSKPLSVLMEFIGAGKKTILPVSGMMSKAMFKTSAKGADRFKGMALDIPMPKIKLSSLPGAFSFQNAEFKIAAENPSGETELWVGLVADIEADLLGTKIDFTSEIGFQESIITLEASSDSQLPSPFGIKWLALKDLELALEYDEKGKSGDLDFSAVPVKPFGGESPKISIRLEEENGKLAAGILKIEEKVNFTDLPILKGLPHADQFAFTFLEISESGISGGSLLHGEAVDAVVFEHNKKWTFAVSDNGGGKGFKFDRVMPALKSTPLNTFHLNDVALIFSQTTISGEIAEIPEVAQKVFTEIYGSTDAEVDVKSGITIVANLSPENSRGSASKGLTGIGLHDDLLIEGTIENIFGGKGNPGIDILVQLEQGPGSSKGASHSPKMAVFPSEVGFFLQYKADELDLGLDAVVALKLPNKDTLDLDTKLELELTEKGFGVAIFMELQDKTGTWDRPFGIPGVDLEEVAIKFGITMEGEAKFGFSGKVELVEGAELVDVAAEVDFLLEAEGLPDGIAMRGAFSELGIPAMIEIAERMAGGGAKILPPDNIPLPEFRDVSFAFATPGASDPQLGLVDSGFKVAGNLFFLGRELGKADISAGPSGIKMDASIDPIDLKLLNLIKNNLKLDLSFTELPVLAMTSEIEFLGLKEDASISFNEGIVDIGIEQKIGGGIWDSKISFGFLADQLDKGGMPDIFLEGSIESDFFAWLRDQAPQKVSEFFDVLNKKFESAVAAINHAEDVVNGLNGKIQKRKEVIQREKASADAAIQSAEQRVRSVKGDVDYANNKYHAAKKKCSWKRPGKCIQEGYWATRRGIEDAAYQVAEGVLRAAQAAVDHLPSELMDPQLLGLEAEHATAMAALELAKGVIHDVEAADQWMAKGLNILLTDIGKTDALVIKEIYYEGDLDGMFKGQPVILTMDLEVFEKDLGTQMFAFKLDDPVFNAEQLAFVPLHMVSELFSQYLPKSLDKLMGPVLTEINKQMESSAKKVYDELKSIPGLNLPADLQKTMEEAAFRGPRKPLFDSKLASLDPLSSNARVSEKHGRLAINLYSDITDDTLSSYLILSQATQPETPNPTAKKPGAKKSNTKKKGSSPGSFRQKLEAYQQKKKNLLLHQMDRNKSFGSKLADFTAQQEKERAAKANDMFVAHTDIHVPPGELFTQKLMVTRHSKLCLGENGTGKITFHPCSENPGGLLWATKRILVDRDGHVIPWNEKFAKTFPNRVYAQLIHNGACLTTPFHLTSYSTAAKTEHFKKLASVASGKPDSTQAHLSLSSCKNDGKGQLWKVVKITHSAKDNHGFKLQERNSGYCLRPDKVKAHAKKSSKEVKAVFYPCSGIAHATFELTVPNNTMPVWYDHNGVIKTDNGFCLDVPNEPLSDQHGSVVFLQKCEDDEFDRWDYVVEYDKTVKIINDFTGHCLYPYQKEEGSISDAQTGQIVQRPCDARHTQGWKMHIIPKQKWFQLEATDSSQKGTNKCMVPEVANPTSSAGKVNVFLKDCHPATRGRWSFDHWKGTYIWTEWTLANATPGSSTDLTTVYWISQDSLTADNTNGVCRVVIGDHSSNSLHKIYPGTWRGSKNTCTYIENNRVTEINPSQENSTSIIVEVLSGLDIGNASSLGSWKISSGGVPVDSVGQNAHPPAPAFSAFLVGGDNNQPAFFLCRVKSSADQTWRYGYQSTSSSSCNTDAANLITGAPQTLVFKTVKNLDTGN